MADKSLDYTKLIFTGAEILAISGDEFASILSTTKNIKKAKRASVVETNALQIMLYYQKHGSRIDTRWVVKFSDKKNPVPFRLIMSYEDFMKIRPFVCLENGELVSAASIH